MGDEAIGVDRVILDTGTIPSDHLQWVTSMVFRVLLRKKTTPLFSTDLRKNIGLRFSDRKKHLFSTDLKRSHINIIHLL